MPIKFTKLTRSNMRNLKVGELINEHGILFERLSNGDGRYTVNIMVDAQRLHRVIGKESDGTTRTQAEEFIEKARQDAKAGRLNLPKGRKIVFGFKEAAEKYLEKQEAEGAKNLKSKRYQLRLHLIPFFNETPLSKITTSDIEHYKKFRLNQTQKPHRERMVTEKNKSSKIENAKPPKKIEPGTVNRELAVLSHLFTKALEWNWLDKKTATIVHFKEDKNRITYLTVEQIDRLMNMAKQDQNPRIYPFIMIGLETAMRRTEILSIKLSDIDLDRRIITIPKAKAGARQQPITTHFAKALQPYLKNASPDQIWLFPANSASGHAISIEKPFRRVVEAAELDPDKVVRHTMRHTAITHLVQAGVDLPTAKRISGHKTLQMVERYSHQNGAHIQAAMDRLEQRYNLAK